MEDREVLGRIGELVDEERELHHGAGNGGMGAREHGRLRQLEVKGTLGASAVWGMNLGHNAGRWCTVRSGKETREV